MEYGLAVGEHIFMDLCGSSPLLLLIHVETTGVLSRGDGLSSVTEPPLPICPLALAMAGEGYLANPAQVISTYSGLNPVDGLQRYSLLGTTHSGGSQEDNNNSSESRRRPDFLTKICDSSGHAQLHQDGLWLKEREKHSNDKHTAEGCRKRRICCQFEGCNETVDTANTGNGDNLRLPPPPLAATAAGALESVQGTCWRAKIRQGVAAAWHGEATWPSRLPPFIQNTSALKRFPSRISLLIPRRIAMAMIPRSPAETAPNPCTAPCPT